MGVKIIFILLFISCKACAGLYARREEKKGGTLKMAKVIRKSVLTVGGLQNQFIGVQVGEFLLRPDSDSGVRPSALRVEGRKTTLVVEGGEVPLRVKLHSEGITYQGFQSRLTNEQGALLAELASDLHGRIWPDAGETLQRRIETLGEDNVLQALQNLFKGVEGTIRKVRIFSSIPFVGQRLADSLYPCNN